MFELSLTGGIVRYGQTIKIFFRNQKKFYKEPHLTHPPIKTYRFTGEAFSEGVETHELDGVIVRIYSPEKTLADCFKSRNKVGLDTVVEAVRFYRERKPVQVDELMRYAAICRVKKIIRPLPRGDSLMARNTKNTAASVHQRLLDKARESARPFNEFLQHFAIERFIYRLSRESACGPIHSQGGLDVFGVERTGSRPAMDIDLLGESTTASNGKHHRREVPGHGEARHPEQPDEGFLRRLVAVPPVRLQRGDAIRGA